MSIGKKDFFQLMSLREGWDSYLTDDQKIEIISISIFETQNTYVPIYLLKKWNLNPPVWVIRRWFRSAENKTIKYWLIRKFPKKISRFNPVGVVERVALKYHSSQQFELISPIVNNRSIIITDQFFEDLLDIVCEDENLDYIQNCWPESGETWRPKNFTFEKLRYFLGLGFKLRQDELADLTIKALNDDQPLASCLRSLVTDEKAYWNRIIFTLIFPQSDMGAISPGYTTMIWLLLTPNDYFPLLLFVESPSIREIILPKVFLWLKDSPEKAKFAHFLSLRYQSYLHPRTADRTFPSEYSILWRDFESKFILPQFRDKALCLVRDKSIRVSGLPAIYTLEDYRRGRNLPPIERQRSNFVNQDGSLGVEFNPIEDFRKIYNLPVKEQELPEIECPLKLENIGETFLICGNKECPHYFDAEYYKKYLDTGKHDALICPIDKTYKIEKQLYQRK